MCRLLGWVSREPATAREVLGAEHLAAFMRLARIHADGWGAAFDGADGPVVERSVRQAETDPAFLAAMTARATRTGIVHIRWATPGLPIELRNTHPFLRGGNVFAHNGAIYPVDHLDRLLEEPWNSRLKGTTDSEKYFLAILAELDDRATDVPTAVARVTARLAREYRPSSLNALLEVPSALYVINSHDPAAVLPPVPPGRGSPDDVALDHAAHFTLRYRVDLDAVVVASSGIVPEGTAGWQLLPNDTVLVIDRGTLATQQVALGSGLGAASGVAAAGAQPIAVAQPPMR